MRLWSLHPRHLDAAGLVACWREGLLARAVLSGATRGYRNHPQLERFRAAPDPLAAIDCLLSRVADEAAARGYRFDSSKIEYRACPGRHMTVTEGQVEHETAHLAAKLAARDPSRHAAFIAGNVDVSPCFSVVPGPVESWERQASN